MARLVMKFGGVSVADGQRLRHVGDLVKLFNRDNEIVLVTSALQGVTDSLLECARKSAGEGKVSDVIDFIETFSCGFVFHEGLDDFHACAVFLHPGN